MNVIRQLLKMFSDHFKARYHCIFMVCILKTDPKIVKIFHRYRDTRRAAKEIGLIVSRTLGILVNLVRDSVLSLAEANAFLETMKWSGYLYLVSSLSDLNSD